MELEKMVVLFAAAEKQSRKFCDEQESCAVCRCRPFGQLCLESLWCEYLIAHDVVKIVRCKDCKHGVWDADEELWKCVVSADWNEDVGDYIGFLEYHEADDYCSYGERRADDAAD